jgi:xylitol oxidase
MAGEAGPNRDHLVNTQLQTLRTNWSRNLVYGGDRLVVPSTVAEAQEAVRSARKVRALGSRHCFNDIADTTGTHVWLGRLNRILSLDKANRQVTVEAGIRYGELGPYLHEQGYALHNTASLPHISVAGAVATATHGSGALGNLATAVAGIEFIAAAGDLAVLSREKDRASFPGAVVHLGAIGVVTKLVLDLQPAFAVRQDVFQELPVSMLQKHFDEIMSSGYSVSVFTDWQGDTAKQVWIKSVVKSGEKFGAKDWFFGARPATKNLHPLESLDAVNCTDQMGVVGPSYDRLPHFRMGFTPATGDELQVEYFVPAVRAAEAIGALQRCSGLLAPLLLMGEIRTIAADDLWMSPCYATPCVAFHFSCKPDWPALKALLPHLEEALAPFDPRPHWGKLFTLPPEAFLSRYPKLAEFRALLGAYDPNGKFRNAFVSRNVFGAS